MKGAAPEVVQALRGTSLLVAAQAAGETNPQDLLTAARADYGQLLGALYAKGYYSGVIRISLDGREVADLSPLEAPVSVGVISVRIETGPELHRWPGERRCRPDLRRARLPRAG